MFGCIRILSKGIVCLFYAGGYPTALFANIHNSVSGFLPSQSTYTCHY